MFERFTDRARRVIVLAQEEARLLNHNYIGTEHILLGLIHEGEGIAAMALESLGVSVDGVRGEIERIIGVGTEAPHGSVPFTPRAKKVLELSLREAVQLGHDHIGTEHILLGLLREGEGVAAKILTDFGVDLGTARRAVVALLQGQPPTDPATGQGAFVRRHGRSSASPRPGPVPGPGSSAGVPQCSFCHRDETRLRRVVRSRDATICDECLARAQDLVANAGKDDPKRLRFRSPALPQLQTPESEEAVEHAFETVFSGDASIDDRLLLVEGAANLRAVVSQMVRTARRFGNPEIWVDLVRFISTDEAEVSYSALLAGGGRMPLFGHAVLEDGVWKVSRTTYHQMVSTAGIPLPPPEDPAAARGS